MFLLFAFERFLMKITFQRSFSLIQRIEQQEKREKERERERERKREKKTNDLISNVRSYFRQLFCHTKKRETISFDLKKKINK